jgi:Protein of unknown function (DUF2934)
MTDVNLRERIEKRAYALWEQEGRADDHWRQAEVNPGAEAPPGTSGAGEHICTACEGTGRIGRKRCTACGGTGRTVEVPEP